MYGEGISKYGDILDLAADNDIIVKSGAWYAYEGDKIGQGRENAKQYLKDNPKVCDEIEKRLRDLFDLNSESAPAAAKSTADSKPSDGK